MTAQTYTDLTDAVGLAVKRAQAHLVGRQDAAGWWKGELRTNVTMDAEDLLLRQFLGHPEARRDRRGGPLDPLAATRGRHLGELRARSWRRVDNDRGLRRAAPGRRRRRRAAHGGARAFILAGGGIEASRVFTRIWLALFGEWSWDDLPSMPPELVLLPKWFPLNVYDWGCWARQTVVAITIVATLRPVRPLPFSLAELRTGVRPAPVEDRPSRDRLLGARQGPQALRPVADQAGPGDGVPARHRVDPRPAGGRRRVGRHPAAVGLFHPGAAPDRPLRSTTRCWSRRSTASTASSIREETPDGVVRRLEACQSPVWDTCLAVIALCSMPGADVRRPCRCARRSTGCSPRRSGSRATGRCKRPDLDAAGWAFEFANDVYPDIDDTAEVVLALRRIGPVLRPDVARRSQRGTRWTVGMQSRDGGWGAFDADNTRRLVEKLPFCDFGAVIDPPSADVTAHVVEMLGHSGHGADTTAADAACDGCSTRRRPTVRGSAAGARTTSTAPARSFRRLSPPVSIATRYPVRRAVRWLEKHQNADGGWGEDLRSYVDDEWRGRGESTPSQTAWALLGLLAVDPDTDAVTRGVDWLVRTQRADGGWDEDLYTGTGFPGDFYINYEMYRVVFPLSALGRYLTRAEGRRSP